MRHALALLFALALIGSAFGQQLPTPEAARLEAMGKKILTEIDAGLTCSSDAIRLKAELAAARTELETAKAKLAVLEAHPAPAAAPEPEAKP